MFSLPSKSTLAALLLCIVVNFFVESETVEGELDVAAANGVSNGEALRWYIDVNQGTTGSYGGLEGSAFLSVSADDNFIKRLIVRSGTVLDSVEVLWMNGQTAKYGGDGGRVSGNYTFNFEEEEYVESIVFHSLLFARTNTYMSAGFVIKTNEKTAKFGPLTGDSYRIQFAERTQTKLVSVQGRTGDYFNSIGFGYYFKI